eukprot:6821164-Prorocentrum_lima.AAC.1
MQPGIHHWASISEELKNFEHTAVRGPVSKGMMPHRDGNNMGPNWTISMGTFTGGPSWTKQEGKGPYHL